MRRSERKTAPAVTAGRWRRSVALGVVSSVAVTTFGLPALADVDTAPDETTESAASNIDLSLLGQELAGGGQSRALFPGGPATDDGALNASLLGGQVLDLGGVQLPIDEIIDYGELGALLSQSTATDAKNGEAISGIAGADGSVSLDGEAGGFGTAKFDLLSLFRATGADGLTDDIVSQLELTAGVGGAHVQAVDGEFQDPDGVGGDGQYRVAEANLELVSPVVGQIADGLYDQIGTVDQALEDTINGMSQITDLIGGITNLLPVGIDASVTAESNIQEEVFQELLAQPITSKNEVLSIDLSTGRLYVDLDKAYSGERPEGVDLPDGINNQNPNTELISNEIYPIIGETVHDLIEEVAAIAISAVEGAISSITLNFEINQPNAILGDTNATWSVNLGAETVEPVDCSGPACAVVEPLINSAVIPLVNTTVVPIRDFLLGDGGHAIYDLLITDIKTNAMTVPIRQVLEPVFTLLAQVVSVQLNRQVTTTCEGPDGELTDSLEVSALSVGVLQAADAGRLNLGTAGVRIGACEDAAAINPAVTLDPTSVAPGELTNLTGTGFTPEGDVTVQLADPEGNPVGDPITVAADPEGNVPATEVPVPEDAAPGDYNIVATDVTTDTPVESPLTVTDGSVQPGIGSIGDTVFSDDNGDGLQDDGEAGVPDTIVNLLDAEGNPVNDAEGNPRTTTTDENGNYTFGELPEGDYTVQFIAPEGKAFSPAGQGEDAALDSDPDAEGITPVVSVTADAPTTDAVDAGLVDDDAAIDPALTLDPTSVAPGESTNATGNGFTPEGDVTLQLTDPEGNPVGDPITVPADPEGNIPATEVPVPEDAAPGDYKVVATDATTDTPVESPLTVTDGSAPGGNGELGDRVWRDADANGVQDAGEAGLPGVTVNLLDAEGNPVNGTDGQPVSATTDDSGNYTFAGLELGEYTVEFVAPEGASFSPANAGDDRTADSNPAEDGRTEVVALTSAAPANTSIDAGIVDAPAPDEATLTVDPPEVDPGEETQVTGDGYAPNSETTVQLADSEGNPVGEPITVTTDENGHFTTPLPVGEDVEPGNYTIGAEDAEGNSDTVDLTVADPDGENPNPNPGGEGELGDRVWRDTNSDGIQDANESGLAGAVVNLLDAEGNAYTDAEGNPITTTTDENGSYAFTGLALGEYIVEFAAPEGAAFSPAEAGEDAALDSNANENGRTSTVTLTAGAPADRTIDAGIVDAPAVDEATVTVNPTEVAPGGTTTVNGEGYAPNSTVVVQLVDQDGNPVGEPVEVPTDENGNFGTEIPVPEDAAPGDYTVNAADGEGNTDDTALTVTDPDGEAGENNGVLGDRVWRDANGNGLQDAGESGLADVKVNLLDAEGNPVADEAGDPITTTTNENGTYSFAGLRIQQYLVEFEAPEGAAFAPAAVGNDRGIDSDAGEDGRTEVITLTSQAPVNNGVDAGVTDAPAVDEATVTVNPETAAPGENTTVTGDGYAPNSEVTITLTDQDGNPVGDPITVTTDENGHFSTDVAIPEDASEGEYTVTAEDADGNKDTTVLEVTGTDGNGNDGASIGDFVWNDSNKDGIQSADEAGVPGVGVSLLDEAGNAVLDADGNALVTTTGDDGKYGFGDLNYGEYTVQFNAPQNAVFTKATAGNDRAADSDANQDGRSAAVQLSAAAASNQNVDAGLVIDENAETPSFTVTPDEAAPGEEVTIEGEGYEPNTSITIELRDKDGNVIGTVEVMTDDDGKFTAKLTVPEDAQEGDYKIAAVDPKGVEQSRDLRVALKNAETCTAEQSIAVTPSQVKAGESVTVTGQGFTEGQTVEVAVTGENGNQVEVAIGAAAASQLITIGESCGFEFKIQLPDDIKEGAYTVVVSDQDGNKLESGQFEVVGSDNGNGTGNNGDDDGAGDENSNGNDGLANTGAEVIGYSVLGLLAAAGGVILTMMARRRAQRS